MVSGRELSMKVLRYLAEIDGLTERRNTLNKVKSPNQRVTNPRMTIHFDAAFNSRDFKSMAGMVAWDQKGVLLTTKTVLNSNVSSSFVAEAYVKLHVVKLENSLTHRIAKEALRREEETHLEGEALNYPQMSPEGRWRRFPD
ncbi:hypothetical protein GOBAR_DD17533 [Gossypium barbadense]|nr:hypothetical protein GOBAR_DD17533 [Gossypium barbadense]